MKLDLVRLCRKLLNACLVVAEKRNAEMLRVVVRTPCNLQHTRKAVTLQSAETISRQSWQRPCPQTLPILLSSSLSTCAFMQGI